MKRKAATHRKSWEARRKKRSRRTLEASRETLQFVLDNCPGYNLGKAYKRVTRQFEEEFRSSELTLPQFAVLVNTGVDEPASGSEIARRLGSDLSTTSRTMDVLERRGLVKESRGEDRRVRMYELTKAGCTALDEALSKWNRVRLRITEEVDQKEWETTLNT
ncbi:MAG: MarR family winged helix-turn-helix transcriptional regulator, partial [Spirochaetaceae bacterium]